MVNYGRLLRKDGVVSGVEVHQFHQDAAGWLVRGDDKNGIRIAAANGRWSPNESPKSFRRIPSSRASSGRLSAADFIGRWLAADGRQQ